MDTMKVRYFFFSILAALVGVLASGSLEEGRILSKLLLKYGKSDVIMRTLMRAEKCGNLR